MKQNRVISTAVLFLLLGTTAFAYAKKGPKEKGGGEGNAKQAQHKQQPQHAQKAQRTQQAQRSQQPRAVAKNRGNNGFHGNGNNGNHYGRIPDDRFRASFGRDHKFRINRRMVANGYQRFHYSGYWFGYNDPWPSGWDYNDDVYVDYVGGAYYLYNPRHSGIRITLNLF
jgi:hypothetical protein